MSTCQNCKASLSCSCQKREAVNGANVCSNCLTSYNHHIATGPVPLTKTNAPVKPGFTPKK